MTEPFVVIDPVGPETPVIVEIPHAGIAVPPVFMPDLLASARAVGRDADLYVDGLYERAPQHGAAVLLARISRYVVDLNRDATDVDEQSVEGAAVGHATRGVIWRVTSEGERCLAAPLRRAAFEDRMRDVYRPYHARLAQLISSKKNRFGLAVVLAGHSMPSLGRSQHPDRGHPRADVVPGSQGRTSAAGRFIDAVDEHARQAGFSVAHDAPYRGGYTTQHYGRPDEAVHVVQVEIARRLYMDELNLRTLPGKYELMRAWCGELVFKLGRAALV